MATEVSQVTQTTSNIPDWAKPYAERLLGESEKLSRRGYQAYPGQITAEFNPLQEQAFRGIAQMDVAPQVGQATGLAGLAGLRAMGAGYYSPISQQQFYSSPFDQPSRGRAGPLETGGGYVRGPEVTYGQTFSPVGAEIAEETPRDFGSPQYGQTISPMSQADGYQNPLTRYMSPYMQGVVEQQKKQAIEDYSRQIPGLQAAGIRAGARGGTREALLQAEAQRGLQNQLGGIQATGLQNAFQQAQAQAAQDAALRAQYGLAGANLAEQSRQFGAGLGIQGIGQQLAAAGTLGQLGQQQYGQKLGIGQAQLGAGAQIQSLAQQDLTNRYQQFLDQQRLPFQQLSWFSDILRGTPASGATQTLYQQPPNVLGQVAGLGLGLGSLFGGSSS
jgi:hypothetical protein